MRCSTTLRRLAAGLTAVLLAGLLLSPQAVWACACGCGIFDVGTSNMFPSDGGGGTVYLSYSYLDQNQNWHGTSAASAKNNDDKEIKTDFYSVGGQYLFNRSWGASVDIPYWYRYFRAADEDTGEIGTFNHAALGDIKLQGIYTGLSEDLSTGIKFGLKLPTGDWKFKDFDRDVEIGTGSTDVLLSAYHLGKIGSSGAWSWFAQAQFQDAVAISDNYRPGNETVAAAGINYDAGAVGPFSKLAPVLQVVSAYRDVDSGKNSDPSNTGYKRIYVSPGLQMNFEPIRIYADVELPVYQWTNGNQLVAPYIFKVTLGYAI